MIWVYSLIVSFILLILSYPLLKTYQMTGYKPKKFFEFIMILQVRANDKNKLVFTKRMLRFLVLYFLILWGLMLITLFFVGQLWLIILDIVVMILLQPLFVVIAHMIILPIEEMIKKNYISKAEKSLANFKGTKIAIVGSFGKTSVKNILSKILCEKFKTVMTPKNFNTPMGITKTVFQEIKSDTQVAIFEMGAKKEGDIKELVKIVDPDIGVMTAIGEQHLETFKNIETVKRTKNELVKNIKQEGIVVFNGASELTFQLFLKCDKKKVLACKENGDVSCQNLAYSRFGTTFDLKIGDQTRSVRTKLLGAFNVDNIVLASAVANLMGLDIDYIASRIEKIEPIKNRLELIDCKTFSIIDDSYNANPVGCEEALNVLRLFDGEKIVVTAGMVELGEIQYEKNFVLGKKIGEVANDVVVMNETNKKAIIEGLKTVNFSQENIYYATTREEQKQLLKKLVKKDCVVLFQNDLPDIYR